MTRSARYRSSSWTMSIERIGESAAALTPARAMAAKRPKVRAVEHRVIAREMVATMISGKVQAKREFYNRGHIMNKPAFLRFAAHIARPGNGVDQVSTRCNNLVVLSCQRTSTLGIRTHIVAAGVSLLSAAAWAQKPAADEAPQPTQPAKPRVYALVAAMGEQFSVVTEVSRTGTHLAPYQRHTERIPHDLLNALALHSLD